MYRALRGISTSNNNNNNNNNNKNSLFGIDILLHVIY